MDKFTEALARTKELVNSLLTKESPKETIDLVANVNTELDSMKAEHETLAKDKTDIQELYIGLVKKSGSTEKPKEDEPETPKSLEEFGLEAKQKESGGK